MLKMEQPGKRKRGRHKRRFLDVPGEDMQIVVVREKDAEEMERLKMMIYCDNS